MQNVELASMRKKVYVCKQLCLFGYKTSRTFGRKGFLSEFEAFGRRGFVVVCLEGQGFGRW